MSQDSSSSSKPGKASPTKVDPEVKAKPERRQFSAEYKRRILEEADACTEAGQIGALLRREGLYSSPGKGMALLPSPSPKNRACYFHRTRLKHFNRPLRRTRYSNQSCLRRKSSRAIAYDRLDASQPD